MWLVVGRKIGAAQRSQFDDDGAQYDATTTARGGARIPQYADAVYGGAPDNPS